MWLLPLGLPDPCRPRPPWGPVYLSTVTITPTVLVLIPRRDHTLTAASCPVPVASVPAPLAVSNSYSHISTHQTTGQGSNVQGSVWIIV